MRAACAGRAAARGGGGLGAGLRRQYRRESPARRALRPPPISNSRSALRKSTACRTLGPPSAASSTRVSAPFPPAPASLCPLSSLSVATNPLTRSLLLQMPGSTRRGCTPKVSGRGKRRAEIRLGGAPPTRPLRRPGSAPRALRPCGPAL